MSILILVLHYLDICNFVVKFGIAKYESLIFVLFFKIILAILGSLNFHMNFSLLISVVEEARILVEISLNL